MFRETIWLTITLLTANALHLTIDNELLPTDIKQTQVDDNLVGTPSGSNPTSDNIGNGTSTERYTATTAEQTSIDNNTISTENISTTATTISTDTTSATNSYENHTQIGDDYVSIDNSRSEEIITRETLKVIEPITTPGLEVGTQPDRDQSSRSNEILSVNSNEEPEAASSEVQVMVVQTTNGPVQGFEWLTKPHIIGYVDVPYGAFAGYFQDSMSPESWKDIHKIKEHSKRCPQLQDDIYVGDLDCLTLSIFKPLHAANASVLFHIHDSNFTSGSADPAVYGPDYFVSKGIILILPNYRLGPLGFLCLRNKTAPGNAALKDLTLALNWTKENIAAFGGNPSNIVISGDGTSGALAGYLALSSKSNKYISKVITETGSVLSHWALDRNPALTAVKLAEKIRERGLYNNTFEDADVETIVRAGKNIDFKPCIEHNDRPFMANTPWEILHNEEINITFMMGTANYAGAREAFNQTESSIAELNDDFGQFLPGDLQFQSYEERTKIGNQVRKQYFGETNISLEHVEELSLCFTDAYYLAPGIRTARPLVQAGATVYLYEFAFVGELNRELVSMNRPVEGAVRGDIVGYLFTQDGTRPVENTKEKRMVDLMIDLWISFIKTGNPKADNVDWSSLKKTYEAEQEEWLSIGQEVQLRRGLHLERLNLWTDIYKEHFIERNNTIQRLPNTYILLIIMMLFWIGFCKTSSHL